MKTITKTINNNINEISTFSKATLAYEQYFKKSRLVFNKKETLFVFKRDIYLILSHKNRKTNLNFH
jgi:hypothetical protein